MSTRTSALDTVVFGVDVQSGDVRGDAPSYALVRFDGEISGRDVVSRRKLLRLIDDERPAIVATDNMYELAADKDELVQLLGSLPEETDLVQVTGDERPEPLSRVASRHGVPYGKEPMQEAAAAAHLAARNVGYEVSAFTDTTEVKVSRGRSVGKGGWSEDRYTRRIHGSVRTRVREIEDKLDEAGFSYEVEATEKYGGYANAVFTVEAPVSGLPVKSGRAGDVRVEVEPVRRDGIEFRPLAKRRDHVIVGLDPGTTTAVALLDLDGEPLDVMSTRTGDAAMLIEWIIDRGRPVIVAADVHPMPNAVEKIRRSFDAGGWRPENDLSIDEKLHRTRHHGYDNDHERDALAAALFAFDAHEDQFDRIASKVPPTIEPSEVIARVVAGDESVEAALSALNPEDSDDEEETEHVPREPSPQERRIKELKRRIERLEAHVDDLETTIEAKDERLEDYEERLSEARREERRDARERRTVTRLERENQRLERELDRQSDELEALGEKLERLKALWKLDHSHFEAVSEKADQQLVSLKPVEQFTVDAIETAEAEYGLAKGDVILLRDASGAGRRTAERLAAVKPRVILKEGGLSEVADEVLFEHGIPVGPAEDVAIQEVDELAVARESDVEAVIEAWRDRARDRTHDRNAEMVDRLISEHRAERRDVPPGELLDT